MKRPAAALLACLAIAAIPRAGAAQAPKGAYATGGVPGAGPARARTAFETDLPAFVVAVNAGGELAAAEATLLSAANRDALGRPVFAALEQVVAAARAAHSARSDRLEAAGDELAARARKLDAALAAAGLGYWIDSSIAGDGDDRAVILFSFVVDRVSLYQSGGKTLRALQLSRLDNLNWNHRAYGFTAIQDRGSAVVLLGSIEQRLMGSVLPALDSDSVALFGVEPEVAKMEWHRRARRAAATAIRADLPAAVDRPLGRVAERLAQRAALFASVAARLETRGIRFTPVATLSMPADYRSELETELSAKELATLASIESDLTETDSSAAFAAARQALAMLIEQHELQHTLDLAGTLPMPRSLADYTGPARDRRGKDRPFAMVARAELSAYLAELARAPLPRLTLIQLADFAFNRDMWSTPECYAALVILDELSRDLGVTAGTPLLTDDEIDRSRVSALFTDLISRPPSELAASGKRSWKRLFRRKLPSLAPVSRSASP